MCIHSITFNKLDVLKIIRALDVNKAHDQNYTLIRMIKLCANAVAHPLTLTEWEKSNIVPIPKEKWSTK